MRGTPPRSPRPPDGRRSSPHRAGPSAGLDLWATHFAPAAELFLHNVPGVAWRTKPSWYIVANNDQTVNPELERFAAKRMGAAF
jgi:hypothetical protein